MASRTIHQVFRMICPADILADCDIAEALDTATSDGKHLMTNYHAEISSDFTDLFVTIVLGREIGQSYQDYTRGPVSNVLLQLSRYQVSLKHFRKALLASREFN